MAGTIEVHPSDDGQFYFTVNAANGQVLVTSETYTRHEDAVRGAHDLVAAVTGHAQILVADAD